MPLNVKLGDAPGATLVRVIRGLPDGAAWVVSDPEATVVVARHQGELVREIVMTPTEEGWLLECLASRAVSELVLAGLVAVSVGAGLLAVGLVAMFGPEGAGGLMLGLVLAGCVPATIIAVGRPWVDPGRDGSAEANLERQLRFGVASDREGEILSVSTAD